jgi:UDP-N-acetylglucosamine 2-epimerase (non-hydrolysing)
MLVVFPIHPRTSASMQRQGLSFTSPGVRLIEPLGYVEFLSLVQDSAAVLTDSGGMQEETTYLGIPCFTLRDNTERPITCDVGTNLLLGLAPERIRELPRLIAETGAREAAVPPGWDGAAAERLVDVLLATDFGRDAALPAGEAPRAESALPQ